jgi:decaprenylphospho-beta-D-erythro-pentofuranosid-2-ulose 2-reductase
MNMSNVKQVLILGANSDIGFALAELFFQKGYNLTLAARELEVTQKRYIEFEANRIAFSEFDALNFQNHGKWFETLNPKPQLVICVFGYLGDQSLAENTWEETARIINTNYTGAVSILNICATYFKSIRSGTIIGISSVAADRGRESNYIYGSAKAGFTAYLSGLRQSLFKHDVHVLTVKPGYINTKMTQHMNLPIRLTLQPEELSNKIYRAYTGKMNIIYSSIAWRLIMFIIRSIPEPIFKRLKL